MHLHSLPCFYHPTTVTLIDDDEDFLSALSLALHPWHHCQLFTNPRIAQQELFRQFDHQQHNMAHYIKPCYETLAETAVEISVSHIYQQIFNPKRFEQKCVVVLDYDMPETDGLSIAKALKAKTSARVIMLTGEADQHTAIEALNQQEIDRFILKSAPDYIQKLNQYITELQQIYFIQESIEISKFINLQPNHPLHDLDFIDLFTTMCAEHQIVEYYLIDECGSFLMMDAQGKITWLVVRTKQDMQIFYELACDENISPSLLSKFESCQKIVFFNKPDRLKQQKNWVIKNATELKPDLYYGLFNESEGYALDKNKVDPYY